MTGWWQTPYPGGIVPVPGFPRELQPGDKPDGPDVEAYKRTVWRAGRWPGPASNFDQAYSRGFALGKGPNVVDTGVAGVQRQQRMPDTGVIDETFFDVLRSIVIPDGLPNAGQLAMDANAANLIAEACQIFQPADTTKPDKTTTREKALAGAVSWLGYTESPANSNNTKFGSWYGMNYQPYCAMAVTYWYEVEAEGSSSFERGSRYAYVPYIVNDARAGRYGLSVVTDPVPGDLTCLDFQGDGTFDHVGLWEDGDARNWQAVEANTSPEGSSGSQSNGGGVYRRKRSTAQATVVFVRVAEP